MLSDIEIASQVQPKPIQEIAAQLQIPPQAVLPYGHDKAKIQLDVSLAEPRAGKLILVTAMTPTPAGEGKTTTTIGLGDALRRLGHRVTIALREPSLGPCFGVKGGAAGGGYAQVIPMADINLHFTGDFHAITSAHNLLSAMLDNHLHQGNELRIVPHSITWKRVMDMNDRALRHIVLGLGGAANGVPRESGFDITTASEIMALLCLARDREDLKARLDRIVVGLNHDGQPVTAADIKASGAMSVLLKDALLPNLVQTLEGTPALVHGGPFGNIAHGCNSVIATRLALQLADYVVTEAGFGSDLGAEKFFDIKCRVAELQPAAAVVVATIRALKMHGGVSLAQLGTPDPEAAERGLPNLAKHCENMQAVGLSPIVALNAFPSDSPQEQAVVKAYCEKRGWPYALSDVWAQGGAGGTALAQWVLQAVQRPSQFKCSYPSEMPLIDKITTVAHTFYGAEGVDLQAPARKNLRLIESLGYAHLPVCIAKTQNSLSDDPAQLGRPAGFRLTVRDVKLCAGAGFVVVYAGNIMTMPGLPKHPAAERITLTEDAIEGLF